MTWSGEAAVVFRSTAAINNSPGRQLPFLPNSRNLAFVEVVRHQKTLFGMYIIVWHVVGRKTFFSVFQKLVSFELQALANAWHLLMLFGIFE